MEKAQRLVHGWNLLVVTSQGEREQGTFLPLFCRVNNPTHGGSILITEITSAKTHLLISSPWGLGFQHMDCVVVRPLSRVQLFATPWTAAHWASLSFTVSWSLSPGVCSNSRPLNQWCYLTISFSATPFSFCLQSFPASGPFAMSWLFTSGGQSIEASASVLPMNIQDWLPLGFSLISL